MFRMWKRLIIRMFYSKLCIEGMKIYKMSIFEEVIFYRKWINHREIEIVKWKKNLKTITIVEWEFILIWTKEGSVEVDKEIDINYFEEWASIGYDDWLDVWRALTMEISTKGKHEGGRKKATWNQSAPLYKLRKKALYIGIHTFTQ